MRARRRVFAALAVALLCAPGTWLRTPVADTLPVEIALEQIAGAADTRVAGWRIAGVWQFSAEGLNFGGYSVLLALPDNRLRAFSDRGTRFTFDEPDADQQSLRRIAQQETDPRYPNMLYDIEAATRDPATGRYWLATEGFHAIQRYDRKSALAGVRVLDGTVDWPVNSGAEAMVRLDDGRFVIIPEGQGEGLIFAEDPLKGGKPAPLEWVNPAEGFVVTDMAQLPDGRLLLLMRNLHWRGLSGPWPPIASLIAVGELPRAGTDAPFAPKIALRFEGVIPRENYEGLALRPLSERQVAVWVIADDNLSVIQRSLLVKLLLDPTQI